MVNSEIYTLIHFEFHSNILNHECVRNYFPESFAITKEIEQ